MFKILLTATLSLLLCTSATEAWTKNLSTIVVPMHFGVAHGGCFRDSSENAGKIYTTTATAAPGDTVINVSGGLGRPDQVIVYYDSTNTYQSNIIKDTFSTRSSLYFPIKRGIKINFPVYSYYLNSTHAGYGLNAIIDYAWSYIDSNILNASDTAFWNYGIYASGNYSVVGGGVASSTAATDFKTPGSANNAAMACSTTTNGDGITVKFSTIPVGNYLAIITMASSKLRSRVSVSTKIGSSVIDTFLIDSSNYVIDVIKHRFTASSQDSLKFLFTQYSGAPSKFRVGSIKVLKIEAGNQTTINGGTHAVYGDSWVAGTITELQARYPAATFINYGRPGATSTDIINKFDSVVVCAPDFVWIIIGTNDFAALSTATAFNANIATLISKVNALGARAILIDCAVGPAVYAGKTYKQLTTLSRDYAIATKYNASNLVTKTSNCCRCQ